MGLKQKGNQGIAGIKRKLAEYPQTLATKVAGNVAPKITGITQSAYSGGRTVYGEARPLGVDGNPLDLHRTGAVEGQARFVATGSTLRATLGPKYSKFLIGKYGILPNGPMPVSFRTVLADEVKAFPKL